MPNRLIYKILEILVQINQFFFSAILLINIETGALLSRSLVKNSPVPWNIILMYRNVYVNKVDCRKSSFTFRKWCTHYGASSGIILVMYHA
jgi:hypothetical protein